MKVTKKQFQAALKTIQAYKAQINDHYNKAWKQKEHFSIMYKEVSTFSSVTKETRMFDVVGFHSRSCHNVTSFLANKHEISPMEVTVGMLEGVSLSHLQNRLSFFGNKSTKEVKELCFYAGVNLLP